MDKQKEEIYRLLMWDYDITPEEIDKLIKGETDHAGHYDLKALFRKMLESLPWFTILKIFDTETIKNLLNDTLLSKLRTDSLKEKYSYVKTRLQEIIPAAR